MIIHLVRGNRDTTDRDVTKRAKSKTNALSVRSAGKSSGSRPGIHKAIGWGVLGLTLVVSIAVLIGFFVAGNQTNVPPTGPGVTENSNTMKPRKSYPVSIAVPEHSVLVPPNAKLTAGTRLGACWSGKWNPITLLSENQDGNLTVRWDDFGAPYDCSMIRKELIIKTDVVKELPTSP